MGVSTQSIAQTLQYGLSGQRMGYLYLNGKQYEIVGEINRQQRNDPNNLKAIYVRNGNGDMVQMENLVDLVESIAPPKLYRYNRFVSATISAGLAEGKTIGDGSSAFCRWYSQAAKVPTGELRWVRPLLEE